MLCIKVLIIIPRATIKKITQIYKTRELKYYIETFFNTKDGKIGIEEEKPWHNGKGKMVAVNPLI